MLSVGDRVKIIGKTKSADSCDFDIFLYEMGCRPDQKKNFPFGTIVEIRKRHDGKYYYGVNLSGRMRFDKVSLCSEWNFLEGDLVKAIDDEMINNLLKVM